MLIVDFNALQTVNLLDFADQVVLGSNAALDSQDILRISMAFGQQCALDEHIALHHLQAVAERDQVALGNRCAVIVNTGHFNVAALLGIVNMDGTGDLGHDSHCLRAAALEQFFNTRKTLSNIFSRCDTASMDGTHVPQ